LSSFLPSTKLCGVARNAQTDPAVAEVQGLYGPFSFPEKLLQKIWLRGDFARVAATTDGRRVRVLHPGKWNLLGGPDFSGARLQFDDAPPVTGEVELHLHATDWTAHAHARDRAYNGVVLHVVLFPPPAGHVTRAADGRPIPVLALLPLLHHDLEEFAAEEAVETLAGRTAARIPEALATLDVAALAALLREHAAARWRLKVHFARLRVQRLGWEAACHHAALEILGYRFNRAPMLHVASRWPLAEWARGAVDAAAVFSSEGSAWSLAGVRPANHPRARLRQYAAWARARPDWPAQLGALAPGRRVSRRARTDRARSVRRRPWRHAARQSRVRRFPAAARGADAGGAAARLVVPLVHRRFAAAARARVAAARRLRRPRPAGVSRCGAGVARMAVGARAAPLSRRPGPGA
jgi:hypothetical protein